MYGVFLNAYMRLYGGFHARVYLCLDTCVCIIERERDAKICVKIAYLAFSISRFISSTLVSMFSRSCFWSWQAFLRVRSSTLSACLEEMKLSSNLKRQVPYRDVFMPPCVNFKGCFFKGCPGREANPGSFGFCLFSQL